MFAPAILPFRITVVVVVVLAIGAIFILPHYGHPRRRILQSVCIASASLFIPACLAIGMVVDFVRYGKLAYDSPTENSYDDLELHLGPLSANGAGFDVWYSPTQRIAYLNAGYW